MTGHRRAPVAEAAASASSSEAAATLKQSNLMAGELRYAADMTSDDL
jgi:hypothetical protein